jgi:DNA-binding CsgD family transcriptional regulator
MVADLLTVIESAYQVDLPDESWLTNLAEAARPHLDQGFGLSVFEFSRRPDGIPEILQSQRLGIPPGLSEIYRTVFDQMDPELRKRPFRMGPCVTGSQLVGMRDEFREHPYMKLHVQKFGMYDSLWITAAEPSGRGLGFHAGRREIAWATPALVARWGRIAAHLATAVRLRHRLKELRRQDPEAPPDAVLDAAGQVHDAVGSARERAAREQLRSAVLNLEAARGPMRSEKPDRALHRWKALVAGRWTLVDQVEHDGRRYILARQNDPVAAGPSSLSPREKQVIAYAKLGHHNKLIAYELGVADSTVRVLLARAATKLGVRGRAELVDAYGDAAAAQPIRTGR